MRKPSSRSQNTTLAENSSISDRDILNIVTDESLLRSAYRFMPSAADDDGSYEAALAQRYYSKLFREYVIADLSRYTTGAVGLRWRTEQEVMRGKGQFICGARGCDFADNTQMSSYEVLFEYKVRLRI
jgi:protein FRA10AC1